ncbi:Hypothetical predicted protein [Scomber scombrus]|uniref:Uncharacterized protein n=1 Tax=Scomber scombrus TaxID=13677 RepID=A0AAV1NGN7_SCOSC
MARAWLDMKRVGACILTSAKRTRTQHKRSESERDVCSGEVKVFYSVLVSICPSHDRKANVWQAHRWVGNASLMYGKLLEFPQYLMMKNSSESYAFEKKICRLFILILNCDSPYTAVELDITLLDRSIIGRTDEKGECCKDKETNKTKSLDGVTHQHTSDIMNAPAPPPSPLMPAASIGNSWRLQDDKDEKNCVWDGDDDPDDDLQ